MIDVQGSLFAELPEHSAPQRSKPAARRRNFVDRIKRPVQAALFAMPVSGALPGEVWRDCRSWPIYAASTFGRIAFNGRVLAAEKGPRGYRQSRGAVVHRLVADAFYGPRPRGREVRHLDGDRLNNRPGNLAYGTSKQNKRDAIRHGTLAKKLDRDAVVAIRRAVRRGRSKASLARKFGVSRSLVAQVVERRCWRWLPPKDRNRPPDLSDGS